MSAELCELTERPLDECDCEHCCDHADMDDGHCLDCGADRTEDLMAAAYDRAKDRD